MIQNFRETLTRRQKETNSLVCVGLDPPEEKIPIHFRKEAGQAWVSVLLWMMWVVDQTAPYACMFKLQYAHWSAIDGGLEALQALVAYIHLRYPMIPVFLDCKNGDIDRTQRQYARAHFLLERVDGMNYNGYMGRSTLQALVDPNYPGRALVGLGRTSNPEAWEVQDRILQDGRHVWEAAVGDILHWSGEFGVLESAGVVMGAAHEDPSDASKIYAKHLVQARQIVGDALWFLIPGIGTQGGFVEETVATSFRGPGSIAINSSSGIILARDPAEAAGELREQIRAAGGNC
ncbi:MAG: orotidine-5'-phosphate decarboxylase [Candidatus Liptonbacteria bacterium]